MGPVMQISLLTELWEKRSEVMPPVDEDNIVWWSEGSDKGQENYGAPSKGHLQEEGFRYVGKEFKNKMKEIVTKVWGGKKGHQNGTNVSFVRCVRKERKWNVQI